MSRELPESDWRLFRELRRSALERFCRRVLAEIEQIAVDSARSFHERYVEAYRLIGTRDRELAEAFDDARRSRAILQLVVIVSRGLLEPDEIGRFTTETQRIISTLRTDRAADGTPDEPMPPPSAGRDPTPTTEIERLEHVQLAMPAGREAAARSFYSGVLGIPEVPKPPELAKRGGVWFESGRLKIHLGVDPDFRPARKAHPGLLVRDLPRLVRKLRAAGIDVIEGEPCRATITRTSTIPSKTESS